MPVGIWKYTARDDPSGNHVACEAWWEDYSKAEIVTCCSLRDDAGLGRAISGNDNNSMRAFNAIRQDTREISIDNMNVIK